MAIGKRLKGKYVDLFPVCITDAEFTLNIRRDAELTKYIPRINGSIEDQCAWISELSSKEFDVFYVIKNKREERLGTISFYCYAKDSNSCEVGRFISYGNAFENIEAVLLVLDYIFSDLNISWILLNNHKDNTAINSLWERFGAESIGIVEMNGWISAEYHLKKEVYENVRERIMGLLKY